MRALASSPILLSVGLLLLSIVIHALVIGRLNQWYAALELQATPTYGAGVRLLIFIAVPIVFAHLAEIGAWAGAYVVVGALPNFDQAFYFSGITYTTVGFGDVVLPAAVEGDGRVRGTHRHPHGGVVDGVSVRRAQPDDCRTAKDAAAGRGRTPHDLSARLRRAGVRVRARVQVGGARRHCADRVHAGRGAGAAAAAAAHRSGLPAESLPLGGGGGARAPALYRRHPNRSRPPPRAARPAGPAPRPRHAPDRSRNPWAPAYSSPPSPPASRRVSSFLPPGSTPPSLRNSRASC